MSIYRGYRLVQEEELASLFEGKFPEDLKINEFIVCNTKVYVYNGNEIRPISYSKIKDFDPKNQQQRMAFHLLWDDFVPVKALFGVAGSGKTRMAMRISLERLRKEEFQKLLIVRQPTGAGDDLGYMKGSKEEKMEAWMKPIQDNMSEEEFIYHMNKNSKFLESIEFEVPAYMLGRDLRHTIVIVDDAQMTTKDQMRMIGTRIGEGSILILCGDTEQILAEKYKKNNGLDAVWNSLLGNPMFGMVYLDQSVRSPVAEMFAKSF